MRTDEQQAAPAVTEPGVGVQQVSGPVQSHDGLSRTGTTVDDESAAGSGADDGVLLGRYGAEHISHSRRPTATEAGDEGGLVVERGARLEVVPPAAASRVNTSSQ